MMQDTTETNACPRCGHENTVDTRFCGNCGLPIDGLCPNCGARNEHSTHYCGNCGHDFTSEPRPSAAIGAGDLRSVQGAPAHPSTPQRTPSYEPRGLECPRCHRANEPGAAFCYNCGLPFDEAIGFSNRGYAGPAPAFATARPSGFWMRFVSNIVDNILITAIYAILAPALIGETILDLYDSTNAAGQSPESFFLNIGLTILYGTVLLGAFATTAGKRLFSMRVVRPSGARAGWARAFLRETVKTVSLLIFPVAITSAFMIGLRADKRSLHDLIADTVVPHP